MTEYAKTKPVCQLDENSYFIGMTIADYDELSDNGTYLIPRLCIDTEAPAARKGFAAKWNGKTWEYDEDHRGETVYSTADGSVVEIKTIGGLPENTTVLPCPDKYHTWSGTAWVEVDNAADLRLADKRAAMPDLTRVQLFKALYLSKKITEADIQAVIDKIADTDQRTMAQIEFQTNAFERSNALLIQAAHALNITDAEIDQMWQTAATM